MTSSNSRIKTDTREARWLIFAPVLGLIITFIAYALISFILVNTSNEAGLDILTTIINSVLFLAGAMSVYALVPCLIINVTLLIHKSRRKRNPAIFFAVFFSFFTWIYTYKKDAWKFWLNLILSIISGGIWAIVAWVWAIIDTAKKPESYYKNYPSEQAKN